MLPVGEVVAATRHKNGEEGTMSGRGYEEVGSPCIKDPRALENMVN